MWLLTHLAELLRDQLLSIALFAIIFLALSPYQIWKLLTNNRPGRGSGHKMWLADRYIQIWLARRALDSSSSPYELRMSMGTGGSYNDRPIHKKTIDEMLEKYWLVRRSGETVTARRGLYLFICNWITYFVCRWYLTLLCGDSRQYYEAMAHPPSRIEKIFKDAALEFITRMLRVFGMLLLLFIWLKVMSWLMPFLPKLIDLLSPHLQFSAPQFPAMKSVSH